MCDFKPGDEVICIHPGPWRSSRGRLHDLWIRLSNRVPLKGIQYTVTAVNRTAHGIGIDLVECPAPAGLRWVAIYFRKVQRRDLSAWLETATSDTDHLDKPLPTKKRERVE